VGFYIRKSLNAGPFRFNLSKSGVGVSAGVPGFRVGAGPRGNYVHMGRGGVYYRATLNGKPALPPSHRAQTPPTPSDGFIPSGVLMEDVTGATAMELAPTGGGDIVEQLNTAAGRTAWGWWLVGAAVVLGLLIMPWGFIVWAALAPVCVGLVLNDRARKTVVVFYDVEDDHFAWYDSLVRAWSALTSSQRLWRVLQTGSVATTQQFKRNSGASQMLRRITASAGTTAPKVLSTNIAVPAITAGKAALYFLPDRVLVRENNRFSDIAYSQLSVRAGQTRFIEDGSTPKDAEQVDQTWQYVNVKGGPDRRYKNNRVLPVMRYGTIDFTTPQGLEWQLQVSRADAAAQLAHAIASVPEATHTAVAAPPAPRHSPTDAPQPPALPLTPARFVSPQRVRTAASMPAPGFIRTRLTRQVTAYPASAAVFTAVDLETTGLDPSTDRIVEIGLIKFNADGTILDEFATLVNSPGSTLDARAIHGIDDDDLIGAPTIDQTLREALAFMAGTVLVAHNCDFEEQFLAAAARRSNVTLPAMVSLCTLDSSRMQLEGRAFSLTAMYKTATGGWSDDKHTALGDARAVREVLLWLLGSSPQPLHLTQVPLPADPPAFNECPISCRPVPLTRGSVAELLDSFPQSPHPRTGDRTEVDRYTALLAEAVDDGRLTYEESEALTRQARRTRLTGTQLRELHRNAWEATYPDAEEADWHALSPAQRREMYLLADALGLTELASRVNSVIQDCAEPVPPPEAGYLRGLRVAVVGDHSEVVDLRSYAESYGAKIAVNITKTVKWMASATPDAADSRHNTARKLGIPIISPAEGSIRIDEAVREAELKAFERQRDIDRATALRQQRAQEADAYWRPSWRTAELLHPPEPEPW